MMYEPDLVQTIPAAGIARINVQLIAGDVAIEATDRADVRVLASGVRAHPELMPSLRAEHDTLFIEGEDECSLTCFQETERVKLLIQLPRGLNVGLSMLTGSLQLNGAYEALDIRLRFGSITGCAPARMLKVRVFAGDVRLGGLRGAADVQLSLGDLTMAWEQLNGGEQIAVRTFVGETALDLPDHIMLVNGRATRDGVAVGEMAASTRITETLEAAGFAY